MSDVFYKFIPQTADFDTLKYEDAAWVTDDEFPGMESLCMLITGFERPDGEWVSLRYYETKDRAVFAAQEEIKEHIEKLKTFLLEEAA
ncbi:hypothetical protein GCM10023116_13200 [Kistimonas scapharcae]|uniref:Uncharacterized protein n=1 Tax=Kistimonas scapharcae TaxID=1036133 RepID=A0ABP8UZE3_9GAMM